MEKRVVASQQWDHAKATLKGENLMEKQLVANQQWDHAEGLRKAGRFADALPLFLACFDGNHDESTLWRCIHCARRSKDLTTAIDLMEKHYQAFSGSKMLQVQFAWLKYDAFLPGLKERRDWEGVLQLADEILALNPEDGDVLFRLVLFAAIDAARNLGNYQRMLELTDMIGPHKLAGEGETWKGRKMMSWRERWYFARLHALYEAGLYAECRELAGQAYAAYPRKIDFARKAALCQEKLGDPTTAERELAVLVKMRNCPWYVTADLARLQFAAGKYEQALQVAYSAAKAFGDSKVKVNLYTLIAKLLLVLGETDAAIHHISLACALRNREHWRIPDDLEQLRQRFALGNPFPAAEIIEKKCRDLWRGSTIAKVNETPRNDCLNAQGPLVTNVPGFIIEIKENRPFAFIQSPGQKNSVFVKLADIPPALQTTGAQILFDLVESFDHKKNCASVRATNIRDANVTVEVTESGADAAVDTATTATTCVAADTTADTATTATTCVAATASGVAADADASVVADATASGVAADADASVVVDASSDAATASVNEDHVADTDVKVA